MLSCYHVVASKKVRMLMNVRHSSVAMETYSSHIRIFIDVRLTNFDTSVSAIANFLFMNNTYMF